MAGPDKRLTDLPELTNPNDGVFVHVVDPFNIADNPAGSSFKVKKSNFGGLSDAPVDGNTYGRKDAAWVAINPTDVTADHLKGSWLASTNTPTLANGVGQIGDYYIVTTEGTQFGILFKVNDVVAYNGSTWYRLVNNNQSPVLTTNANITSADLSTQDVAGFVAYINALNPIITLADFDIRTYTVTDTRQKFQLLLRGRSFGFSEPAISTLNVLELEKNDLFNVFNGRYRVSAIVPIAKGLTTTALQIMDANWVVTGTLNTYVNANQLENIINNDSAAGAGSSCAQTLSNLGRIRTPDFLYVFEFMANDAAPVANSRSFCGFSNSATVLGNVNPSTLLNMIGVGYDTGETVLSVMHNDGSGTATKVSLGANFPSNTAGTDLYRVSIYYNNYAGKYYVKTERFNTSRVKLFETITAITTDFPSSSTLPFFPQIWRNNGTTALSVRYAFGKFYMGVI